MRFLESTITKYPQLIERAGVCVRITNEPFMPLTIESIGLGPWGRGMAISICHYGEQNGDAMRDPEMCFERLPIGDKFVLTPYYWRNDYLGSERESRAPDQVRAFESLARTWNQNLISQGFLTELLAGLATVKG